MRKSHYIKETIKALLEIKKVADSFSKWVYNSSVIKNEELIAYRSILSEAGKVIRAKNG